MRFPLGLSTTLAAYIVSKRMSGERFIPLVLMLEPLFACNLSCTTCGRIREYSGRSSEMMSLEDCLHATTECGAPIVSVCGGEPLIYSRIGELVSALTEMRKYVYLCTNGTALTKSVGKFRPSSRLLLNVHIDGPREVHDVIVEKPGAYDAAVDGIKTAIGNGFQVTVNTTVYKRTDMKQVESEMDELAQLGVKCFMLSPAYSYESVDDKEYFMSRSDVHEKFRNIDCLAARHRLSDTPVYIEFLKGQRELECTAWANPTRNPVGWRSPCYLLADRHFDTYREMIEHTNWNSYGAGRDPRCADCMVHCGFEPTAALMLNKRKGDLWKMIRWQLG